MNGSRIELWWFRFSPGSADEATAYAFMDRAERERYRGFADPAAARFFAFRRAARRLILAEAARLPVGRLAFETSAEGKPFLAGVSVGPEFSASNSGTMGVIALHAAGPVGVDLELVRDIDAALFAERILSPAERIAYAQALPACRPELIRRAWTAKEALVKAMGIGLDLGVFRQIEVPLTGPAGHWHPVRLRSALTTHGNWRVCARPLPGPALVSLAAPMAAEVTVIDAGPFLARHGLG